MIKIKNFKSNRIKIILIIFLAFLLRVYKINQVPSGLYWDEAAMALDAKSVSLTGKDHHGNNWLQPIYPSWGDYKLPGYILSSIPFFKLFKNSPELAIRLPSVIGGTITVLIAYCLIKELFKERNNQDKGEFLALGAGFLLAVSPWHLQFSRAAFEGNLALCFNGLALLFFLKAVKKKAFLIASLFFSVSGIYTYYSARIVLPILLFLAFLIFWKKNLKNIVLFISFSILIYICFLPLQKTPLAVKAEQFRLSTDNVFSDIKLIQYSNRLIEESNHSFISKKIHHRFIYQGKQIITHLFDHFSGQFLILSGDVNLRHSTGKVGVLFIASFLTFIYGQYYLFLKTKELKGKKLFIFLNICLIISFLPASVPYEVPHALRSLNGALFLNIISGIGLIQLIKVLKNRKILLNLFYGLLVIQLLFYLHDYYAHYPSRSFIDWQGGYKEAVTLVDQEYDSAEKIIFTDVYARPYLYFLLYGNYSLEEFQEQRRKILTEQPLNYSETKEVGKIEFRPVIFKEDKDIDKVLIIGTKKEIYKGSKINNISTFVSWKIY